MGKEKRDMLIGAMNHPGRDVLGEIKWMADLQLDFLDLTLEPPAAAPWQIDAKALRSALDDHNLGIIGHTAFYLPFACTFESVRRAAVEETKRCIELFAKLGAKWMNLHPDRHAPFHARSFFIEQNLKTIRELLPLAQEFGVGLMIENVPGEFNSRSQLGDLLDKSPELGLHLDIGHCNLMVPSNTADEIIRAYGGRIRHVHIHDNKGGYADLHLPLGVGNIDFKPALKALQLWGYDSTITLEVFAEDRHYLAYSRDLLRKWWEELRQKRVPIAV
jgi:sugar phosphate isomerase/epimerase